MDELTPLPRAMEGGCVECGGPVHIYEADLQDTPAGLVCGNCTRLQHKRQGRDPRAIDKHFKWKAGHDPNDDEANEDSPFFYVNLQPTKSPEPPNDKRGLGGPPSGTLCFQCLGAGRGKVETRLVAAIDPYALLEATGYKQAEGTPKTTEKDIVTICPKCSGATHWRESEFKRARALNGQL